MDNTKVLLLWGLLIFVVDFPSFGTPKWEPRTDRLKSHALLIDSQP
jgi:hypothetical protein